MYLLWGIKVEPRLAKGTNKGVQTYLGDIVTSVPDHQDKANITIKKVTRVFWFPSAYKSVFTLYPSLLSVQ